MAIPENIINSIRDKADIVEIIDSILPLKKIGANFKALCPFHHEKTPSFVVSAQKQIFHCFGCGEGGNVFHFLIKHQNMSFVDAVKYVASIVGIDVPDSDIGSDYKDILALNKKVADLYNQNLISEDARKCRSYIESRGLKEDTLKTFNLGYAPESWDFLIKKLAAKGFQQQYLFKSGLVARGKDGNSFYDIFRDRLIFPIVDHTGKVLGFGGRAVSGGSGPKYLNSPETPVYQKGRSLYGINITLPEIKKQNMAIVVEGYLDMIMLYQYGIKNVVASLGTALTQDQVRILKRYVDEVVIVYDADQSGQMASLRGLDIIFESGIKAKAVMLPEGYDPDSFIRKKGSQEFLNILKNRCEVFDYKLEILSKIYGKDSLDSRIKIVNEMFSSLNKVSSYLMRSEYMKKLSAKMGFEDNILWDQFNAKDQKLDKDTLVSEVVRQKQYSTVESSLVYIMVSNTDLISSIKEVVSYEEFLNPDIQSLVKTVYGIYPDKNRLKLANLLNIITETEAKILAEIMSEDIELKEDVFQDHLNQCIVNLKIQKIKSYCKFLEQEIKKAQDLSDNKRLDVLFKELNEIKKREVEI